MTEAALSLGANLGDRARNLREAVRALSLLPSTTVLSVSRFYETAPFGVETEQPNYVNCCVRLETGLEAETLLGACLGIEAAMGKVRLYRSRPSPLWRGDPQRPRPDPAPSAHAGTRFCADSPFGYLSRRPRPRP